MKKHLYALSLFLTPFLSQAQLTNPLAHWKMDNSPTDASGNSHNGTLHGNVTPTTGKDGRPNTAYRFAGDGNSYIDVPYTPDLNLTNYSICATVKISGFYNGSCQTNIILQRGTQYQAGNYELYFYDNAFDGDCNLFDSTREVFAGAVGPNNFVTTPWQYGPTISSNRWYSVVQTFDNVNVRTYVDGILMTTVPMSSGVGFSTEAIRIGSALVNLSSYPYSFNGVMDDLRLYNRVLSETDIRNYTSATLATPTIANSEAKISVYPNPAHGTASLHFDRPANGRITLHNAVGQLMSVQDINGSTAEIKLDGYATGLYYITCDLDNGKTVQKLLVN